MKSLLRNLTFAVLSAVFLLLGSSGLAYAQSTQSPVGTTSTQVTAQPADPSTNADNVCKGVLSAETGTFSPNVTVAACRENADSSFGFLVKRIINIFSLVVGAVSVIMIIIGGFRYIISGGDSSGVSGAKNTILYAIVGLIIVLFAQVIIRFILTNAASVTT